MSHEKQWCFGFGIYRTGQNALVKLINAHPEARILNEAWLWGYAHIMTNNTFDYSSEEMGPDIRNQVMVGGGCWPNYMVRKILNVFREEISPDSILFGDVRRHYAYHLDDILKVFPKSKIVRTKRDLREVIASIIHHNWWHKDNEDQESYIIRIADVITGHYDQIYNSNILSDIEYYQVDFKKMASDPKPIVSGLLDYLELSQNDYDWSVLDTVYYHKALNRWEDQPNLRKILGEIE